MANLFPFGERRICYINFAEHLLNAYNPNMTCAELPHRWSDASWRSCIDMIAAFGFNVFEFWLAPRLFCRSGLLGDYGREFARQMNMAARHAHQRGVKVEFIAGLATVGDDWRTLCPALPDEWREIQFLWDSWSRRLAEADIIGIFPGDPGACSRNGCNALNYIDRACDVAAIVRRNLPRSEVELHTWGPPFFGWGIIQGPAGWKGEFVPSFQATAWTFDRERAEASLRHLLRRLPDFPKETSVAINLGFNPDGNPVGDQATLLWACEIARTHRILTWDYSLTEGENAILPHYRFDRLFARRRLERDAAPYSGGISYTMTPRLNQLSLFESARSFQAPDADHQAVAREFFAKVFGSEGEALAADMPLFEVVPDWGQYAKIEMSREVYHRRMNEMADRLHSLRGRLSPAVPFFSSPESYRRELLFFARLFAGLSGPSPDYDVLRQAYWKRVYRIYDLLPRHVDPRPHAATENLVSFFRLGGFDAGSAAAGSH